MNASGPRLAPSNEHRDAVRQLLRLTIGTGDEIAGADWSSMLRIAEAERIAALAWQRGGDVIRAVAPRSVVEQWRSHAMRVAFQVEGLVSAVSHVVEALERAGVHPVVLKGPPLAQRLYGDFAVRPLADCDLFIPREQRADASDAMIGAGWTSRVGEAPGEETFERWSGGQRNVIEVHSSVVDDPLLGHLRIPVERTDVTVGDWTLPAQSGDYLAASLAAHLAKHETAPLLWVIDFHTLWARLDAAERARARAAAHRVGLGRHVDWACDLAALIPEAAAGRDTAIDDLTRLQSATGDWGRVRRLVTLSANPYDAARVLLGRVWPDEWRDSWLRVPNYLLRRGARWIARRTGISRPRGAADSANRALSVDDDALAELLRETLGRGLAVWIRPRGTSMEPAIPPFAQAHIVPMGNRAVRRDDVVLARLRHGQFLLHRVARVAGDKVQLKGDAMRRRDEIVALADIMGLCDYVEIDGVNHRIEDRPRDHAALLASAARDRLSRLLSARR